MKTSIKKRASDILRWQFRMQNRLLTCGIARSANAGFNVVTLPHWDITKATVETFTNPASALRRHAVIAERLRSAGWSIASYTQ